MSKFPRWASILPLNAAFLFAALVACGVSTAAEPDKKPESKPAIDATTLHRKVICGYQGWFRCPGDPAGEGWRHWSRRGDSLTPRSATFEMWPDMSEYSAGEKYAAGDFRDADGQPAMLFSSANPQTVARHFAWMEQYGIDGVFLQRFLVNADNPSFDKVLAHVRASAAASGRCYAMCYDLTDYPADKLLATLVRDWKRLVDDLKITQDKQYLHHNGKPVLFVWGFYSDRFQPELAHQMIDALKTDADHAVTLIGGCQWYWAGEKNAEWARAFRRFDVISAWNIGNTSLEEGRKQASTGYWKDDLAEAKRAGMEYLPVIYPGFGWTNLKGQAARANTIDRLGGEFFWRQFSTAADLGIQMAYVAMFDEVDEATAIFKVSNHPPTQAQFSTYDGLPADWYLRLTGEGSRLIRGERANQLAIPIMP